jgi:GNAT superfamily N-acetyltransferase
MNSYISELDSNRFGFNIAKIENIKGSLNKVLEDLKEAKVKLVIVRVDCGQIELINLYEKMGFQIKDFQVTYKYDLKNFSINDYNVNSEVSIRAANSADIDNLILIADESFNGYGHYFADNRLSKAKCGEIYIDWVSRSVENKNVADIVFVAEKEQRIAGFLSFKIKKDILSYAAGVQGGVARKFRNHNIFRALAHHGLKWGHELNLNWIEHNVLLTNYSVNRSFIKIGFIPDKSFITLHGWLDQVIF